MERTKMERIIYLDGVRGIAAISVVFYHFFGGKWENETSFHLSSLVFNGSDAVSFFFVLSGLVLSYKYFHGGKVFNMPKFLYRRVLRLYPAFIFTVLINYLYRNSEILDWNTFADIFYYNAQQLWKELSMVRFEHNIYSPGWTLGVEMGMSLLVPIFAIAAKKDIKTITWSLLFVIIMGPYISLFSFHFLLGVLLAYYFPKIQAFDCSKHRLYSYRYLIGLFVFVLYSIRHVDRMFPFGETYQSIVGFLNISTFHYTGLASFFILAWIINNPKVQQFFTNKIVVFLGKISYGVYLMHWLVVLYIIEHWETIHFLENYRALRFFALLVIAVSITIVLATLVHYFIEEFFIKISNRKFRKKKI